MKSEEANILVEEKHRLIRLGDRDKSKKEECDIKIKEINHKLEILNEKLLSSVNMVIEKEMEEQKMVVKKQEEKKKALKKLDYKPHLARVLALKSIKDIKSAALKLMELVPEFDEKTARTRINDNLYYIRRKQGFWADYDWEEELFTLSKKKA